MENDFSHLMGRRKEVAERLFDHHMRKGKEAGRIFNHHHRKGRSRETFSIIIWEGRRKQRDFPIIVLGKEEAEQRKGYPPRNWDRIHLASGIVSNSQVGSYPTHKWDRIHLASGIVSTSPRLERVGNMLLLCPNDLVQHMILWDHIEMNSFLCIWGRCWGRAETSRLACTFPIKVGFDVLSMVKIANRCWFSFEDHLLS